MGIKISIIIPIYNVEKYLPRCLNSILAQTMPKEDFEVIMVDDGSWDDSGKICDQYVKRCNNFKVIHQDNSGVASARNTGLEIALGEYVAFVDPDDYIEQEYLRLSYERALKTNAEIVIFDAYKENENRDVKNCESQRMEHADIDFSTDVKNDITSMRCQILYPYMASRISRARLSVNVPLAAPWDKLYKKSFLKEKSLKFQSELKVLDDMCFNFDSFGKAAKITYMHIPLYHYKVNISSITNSYKADRPVQDMKVFTYLKNEIDNVEDDIAHKELLQAYYARIIKSFAICCRLCFFNKKNMDGDLKRQFKQVRKYMNEKVYSEAFKNISTGILEWKLRFVRTAWQLKSPWMLYMLHKLQETI